MIQTERRAFTLVELLVVIAIIGTLMGLLLPAVQSAREAGRANQCRANLTQLMHAMTSYEAANKEYPGYVNSIGSMVVQTKASWGAMLLPFIERQDLWDKYFKGQHAYATIETFICPSNPPPAEGVPAMSYLGNAGWMQDDRIVQENDKCEMTENPANGIFTDRWREPCPPGPTDELHDARDRDNDCNECGADPLLKITFAHIQSQGDGSTHTLLFAEGLQALHWALMKGNIPDQKWHFGFCWEQPGSIAAAQAEPGTNPDMAWHPQYRVINGVRESAWPTHVGAKGPNSGLPSSNHPGGVNVAFVGGQTIFLSEKINGVVYAQLMTSNRKQSDLRAGDKRDRDLPMPDADDF